MCVLSFSLSPALFLFHLFTERSFAKEILGSVYEFEGDGSPVTSSRLYHAGETDDFRSVLLYLSHTYPSAPVYAVGFSMGASTLAVYLGQQEGDTVIKAGVCVSNPWEYVFPPSLS